MSETIDPPLPQQRQFPCKNCGANLRFEPGQSTLKCPYCHVENEIPTSAEVIEEIDFRATLANLASSQATEETLTVKCTACGAESSLNPSVTADRCVFCGSPIVTQGHPHRQIRPKSLLPFHIKLQQADAAFKQWLDSLWFAPNDLKKFAYAGSLKGVYIPYWTYDADTDSHYTGQRGDDYWETQSYTAMVNGKPTRQTRQVRKTRWRSVSGRVHNTFDDILILASNSLPRKYTESLEPWDLANLVPYTDEYLAGFVAESYQVPLDEGFGHAKTIMDEHIAASIRQDIGGDHQRIHSTDTRYDDITFKHVLLPLWISAYRYRDRSFRFLVNARTGEVCGERPYSAAKIALAVLAALIVAMVILFFLNQR